jgi:hypothetical protein
MPTVALSIRQPWAWLIVNGFKDIENRDWPTPFRGEFLVHAGLTCKPADYDAAMRFVEAVNPALVQHVPELGALRRGGIVGMATLVDCVAMHESPWFEGTPDGGFGFVLTHGRPLPFRPWKGRLGFFNTDRP